MPGKHYTKEELNDIVNMAESGSSFEEIQLKCKEAHNATRAIHTLKIISKRYREQFLAVKNDVVKNEESPVEVGV